MLLKNLSENSLIGQLSVVSIDGRRRIMEFNGDDFSIQNFKIKREIPLGNHYHKNKTETFIVLSGQGIVLLSPIDSKTGSQGEIMTNRLEAGSVIRVDPYIAHTFILKPGSKMICFSSEPFDSNNMDMTECILSLSK